MRPFALLLLALTLGAAPPPPAHPNFSGRWSLDAARSDFGGRPLPFRFVRQVDHHEPLLAYTTTQVSAKGQTTTSTRYLTDGTAVVNKISAGDAHGQATWQGNALVMSNKVDVPGTTLTLNETWTLSPDLQSLHVQSVISSPQGDITFKLVLVHP